MTFTTSNRSFSGRYAGTAGVIGRGANHGTTFLIGDGAIRWTEVGSCAGLHLDEYEGVAVPSDKIRFGGAGGSPVIARHHRHALTLEVAMCNVFTPASKGQTGVPLRRRPRSRARSAIWRKAENMTYAEFAMRYSTQH